MRHDLPHRAETPTIDRREDEIRRAAHFNANPGSTRSQKGRQHLTSLRPTGILPTGGRCRTPDGPPVTTRSAIATASSAVPRLPARLLASSPTSSTVVIVLNVGRRVVGMVVDAVSDVITLTPTQLRPVPGFNSMMQSDHLPRKRRPMTACSSWSTSKNSCPEPIWAWSSSPCSKPQRFSIQRHTPRTTSKFPRG